ncbi:MAG: helix-turn-helix domain-containing protein [Deferribacterales bacterium]
MYEKGINEDILKALGERIRENRKAKGFSQEKLAELSDLHPTYISHLETGKANPSLIILTNIANALEVHICDLVTDKNKVTIDRTILDIQNALNSSEADQRVKILSMLEALKNIM